jgi:hypothetical protein
MPHVPDLRSHDRHDLELVAAYAAGDAAGADLETATALVSGCAECAALHHDLRAIAAALPTLPAPARPRDFRLTPGQAASLRPTGWRRFLGALAGPSFRLAAPVGTGLAALGLAGILVGSLGGIPLGMGGAASEGVERELVNLSQASAAPAAQGPSAAPSSGAEVPGRTSDASPVPVAGPDQAYGGQASPDIDTAAGEGASGVAGKPDGVEPGTATDAGDPGAGEDSGTKSSPDEAPMAARERPAGELLAIVGAAALLVGLALVALRWTSRRLI